MNEITHLRPSEPSNNCKPLPRTPPLGFCTETNREQGTKYMLHRCLNNNRKRGVYALPIKQVFDNKALLQGPLSTHITLPEVLIMHALQKIKKQIEQM